MTTYPAPVGRTARRLEWPFLPPTLRTEIEGHCGSPVVEAHSQGSGYTPGFASVLVCQDGSRHFVKAASVKAQRMFAESYREEARKLALLPALGARAAAAVDDRARLGGARASTHVAARQPYRPWQRADLDACLDSLELVAAELTPAPAGARPRHVRRGVRVVPRLLAARRRDPTRAPPPRRRRPAGAALRRGDRGRHPGPHRRARRQRADRRRRSRLVLRLELPGRGRRLARLAADADRPPWRRARRRGGDRHAAGCSATYRRSRWTSCSRW